MCENITVIFVVPMVFLYFGMFARNMDKQKEEWSKYHKTHYYINRKWIPMENFEGIRVTTDWLDLQ